MAADDLPDSHVQLVFAAMLYRSEMISPAELRRQAVDAFGVSAGSDIADRLQGLFARSSSLR